MTKIQTILAKYSLDEYIAFLVGAFIIGFAAFLYAKEAVGGNYDHWWTHVLTMTVGVVLMRLPKLLIALFKKVFNVEA
jgi:ABC-type multidrug transport system permease subunit